LPSGIKMAVKTLTDVTDYRVLVEFVTPLLLDEVSRAGEGIGLDPYDLDDALEDLFCSKEDLQRMVDTLARKKNIILQGPPGVGKTFASRRLAYALIGFKAEEQVEMVQFHQSYSYEDFVQGWRPTREGGFSLRYGVFYEFCNAARENSAASYVFIIDEVNRGNLSKIFGELLMLLEADKRGDGFSIPLTYSDSGERFSVPENVHVIGLMNTADRSLALVDYALRRRFTFFDLRPQVGSSRFREFLSGLVEEDVADYLINRICSLNERIRDDTVNLGQGYEIGHSFFCPQDTEEELDMDWYRSVVEFEIAPLLREYWFDDLDRAEEEIAALVE